MSTIFTLPILPSLDKAPITKLAAAVVAGLLCGHAIAADAADPLATQSLVAPRTGSIGQGRDFCSAAATSGTGTVTNQTLTLAQVVDRALCNNPQTRAAWASARAQAAQLGIARGAYLPSVSGAVGLNRNRNENSSGIATELTQGSASVSASYVLFDFGARDAALQAALESLTASNYTLDATLQRIFLSAVQAYFNLFAARAGIEATRTAEQSSAESLKAATARQQAGTSTPADRLQAQTAYSQAVLNRIQAEGNARSAQGTLANIMGLDASQVVELALPNLQIPDEQFDRNLDSLIAEARKRRPDLAAAEAQVRSAQANIDAARASGKPTLSLTGSLSGADTSLARPTNSQSVGVTLSIPIFSGHVPTYRTELARAQAENQLAQRDTLSQQVALDVWQAHATLTTNSQAVRTSADLLASATASENMASGRYRAGVGSIIDVLTAQTALANARLQNIQAVYNWHLARASLARAMGQLDASTLDRYRASP